MIHQRHEQGVQAEKPGELPLFQLFDKAWNVSRIGDQHVVVAGHHHAHAIRGKGIDMVERQRCDHHLLALFDQPLAIGAMLGEARQHLEHVGHQVAVSEHCALGQTGGAAGVLQHSDVIEVQRDLLGHCATPLTQRALERHSLGQMVVRDHLLDLGDNGIDQPALGRRQHVAHLRFNQELDAGIGQYLLHQFAEHVQVDQRPGSGILELMTHLASGIQRVGVDHDQPGAQGAKHCDRVLQHIGHLHRDTVARHQIGVLLQIGGKGRRVTIQLSVGHRHPEIAERRAVSKLLARAFEHFDHRLVSIHVNVRRNACRALVIPEISLHLFLSSYLSRSGPLDLLGEGGVVPTLAGMPQVANMPRAVIYIVNLVCRCPSIARLSYTLS
ncbi:hypothetical protein D3C79_625200 [compost metagenome]